MIKKISIKNFKVFSSIDLEEVKPFTLIGGKNNAGKTNLLEAIFTFYDRYNPDLVSRLMSFRGVNEYTLTPESMWGPAFYNYDISKEIIIEFTRNKDNEKLLLKYDNGNRDENEMTLKMNQSYISNVKKKSSQVSYQPHNLKIIYEKGGKIITEMKIAAGPFGISYNLDSQIPYEDYAVFMNSRERVRPNEDAERFGALDILDKQEQLLKHLRIIEPNLKSITNITMGNNSYLHADVGMARKVPVNVLGDGLSRLLSILLAVINSKNGVVLIDEIENGIHYSVMSKIIKIIAEAAKENNCQIICTTHSWDCLKSATKAFNNEMRNDFNYIRIEKKTEVDYTKNLSFVMNQEMLSNAVERGWEVR